MNELNSTSNEETIREPQNVTPNIEFDSNTPTKTSQISSNVTQIATDSEDDKQTVSSQSSNRYIPNEMVQANSEIAPSTSIGTISSSNARRPVTWPQNDSNNSNLGSRPNISASARRQLLVRGNRMPHRGNRGTNSRMPRRGNYRF